ncbi:geranylgeranyl diphosphate synthase, type III [Puccinia sorghi]|uniref:(2E,6E)-farnesyl diphosphate synthase n=1 Tax=Puccinia sorghi TaxID=27349 RepID=A0A0L6U552_9BASI|nr:geranylgeranyl diphosphate synthase, type III [Puccinia sorghi]
MALSNDINMEADSSQLNGIEERYSNFFERMKHNHSEWSQQNERILMEPFTYLTSTPGKEIRSLMIDAFNHWLAVPTEQLNVVKRIVGLLHTASLLMDDVEDGSELRRGIPELSVLHPPNHRSASDLWKLVNDELLRLHRGQGMDLYWRDSLTCPTEEEYIQMVKNKTGGLFRIAIKLMTAMSPLTELPDYIPLVDLMGIIFQIRDDLLNLSSVYTVNKGFCEDLTEGKFSFPIVHAIRADPSNHQLLNVLRQRPTDDGIKTYAVSYMKEKTKSLAYTRQVLTVLEGQADKEVSRLGDNTALRSLLDMMHVGPSPAQSTGSPPS